MAEFISKEEAKAMTEATNSEVKSAAVTTVNSAIQKAAMAGSSECVVNVEANFPVQFVKQQLEAMNYQVVYNPAQDQRDSSYFRIRW